MFCRYGLYSMNFSVPRWRSPICGSTRATISPSSSSTRRSTPCAAGCCGPKLMVKLRRFSAIRLSLGLFVAGQRHVAGALPRRKEIEIAEFLSEPHLVVDHALLLVVVAHLDEAGQREILAQRMALEAVVGEQPPEVRMAGEHHAVEVVGLALEPQRAREHLNDRRDAGVLAG